MMMRIAIPKTLLPIPVLLAVFLLAAGCGRKAPPRPPGEAAAPAAAVSLNGNVSGGSVFLRWTLVEGPGAETAATAGFYVYRSRRGLTAADCPGCPVLFERIAAIARQNGGSAGSAGPFEYQEELEKGYRYFYKVGTYLPSGADGAESNTIEFEY